MDKLLVLISFAILLTVVSASLAWLQLSNEITGDTKLLWIAFILGLAGIIITIYTLYYLLRKIKKMVRVTGIFFLYIPFLVIQFFLLYNLLLVI